MLKILIRKCRSAHWRLNELCGRLRRNIDRFSRTRAFRSWLLRMEEESPDVLVGANFVSLGGTRQHMHSIAKYSALNVSLVPDEKILDRLPAYHIANEFNEQFLALMNKQLGTSQAASFFSWILKKHYDPFTYESLRTTCKYFPLIYGTSNHL